jgi:urease accessory protein
VKEFASLKAEILEATRIASGQARLEVELVYGESTAIAAGAASPMKLLTPRSRGRSVWACTSSFGGGLVAGDQTSLDLRIGAGALCYVGTQASTKVYRNPARLPCSHVTRAVLEKDSLLALLPDPVQAFADSSYSQRQEFRLAPGAGLVLLDWLTSGRVARGERWAFRHFQSRNEVFVGNDRVFLDSLLLKPGGETGKGSQPMGRFNCIAMLLLTGASLRDVVAPLLAGIAALPVTRRSALVCSASPVRDGAVLRIAGENVESVAREVRSQLKFLPDLLADDPWERKW